MNGEKLYALINEYLGFKVFMMSVETNVNEVEFIFYDSFLAICGTGESCDRFYVKIGVGNTYISEFLGQTCLSAVDEESIKSSLDIVDQYCRLRLPDRYLEEYEQEYKMVDGSRRMNV